MSGRLKGRMETGFDGYAVNYRDMNTAYHHLAKYHSFDEAMNAYDELDALSDRYMEGDIDVEDYHIAVDDIITDAFDNEYEINFKQIGRGRVWESPYGGVYMVVNPVAVDLYF